MTIDTEALIDDSSGRVKHVTVSTMAITVRALTFGNRQFSKSAFNQILLSPLVAEDGALRGEPLGWVNYHPDWIYSRPRFYTGPMCGLENNPHLHVIWRTVDNLLRQDVLTKYPMSMRDGFRAATDEDTYSVIQNMQQLFVAA